ncbi:N-methyl-L-tryptophan oxidase [Mesorhizobium sp.]|uniref:N-methyl-L-tryptophan oxidase n=1 Tax=Mesorhizobium sp. TaxID=1871066 RepID=UPI000FE40603|nr:N-methyl-L-tryptophan oxidase [Mesorhizobium sp.]RWQ22714.1 MAG: N-methyl-L-tryptophan oxidase [Mesorhizobium sp.]
MKPSVIVVGLGAMGSSTAAVLARRGCRVMGFERFWRAHDRGSSHGDTRAIRKAYVREAEYAPLVLEAYDLWRRLERDSGAELLVQIGGLVVAPTGGKTLARSVATAQAYGIDYELLDTNEVSRRWPTMHPPANCTTFYEPTQSIMPPEKTVATNIELAVRHGAELHFNTVVESWSSTSGGVQVRAGGKTYEADRLVLAGGAWSDDLLSDLDLPLEVNRLLQVWVKPTSQMKHFAVDRHPRWVLENAEGVSAYAFPVLQGQDAIKMAFTRGVPAEADNLQREATPDEVAALVDFMSDLVPSIRGQAPTRVSACLMMRTPDENFTIGEHPKFPNVIIGAGFSSHGFKFVPVIGEILADLAVDGATKRNIKLFDPRRYEKLSALQPG